ncbi:hypothetical protein [Ferruginibacter sp. SUN106]|uniref:hypothetical protein n=1 Tax=Ferruginibacter sp. SUN106 TaxID=2978348 RepID=UPI003D35EE31
MKKFNSVTFIIAVFITGILTAISFFAAFAEDEGTLGGNVIGVILARLFYIFRFPTHTLFGIIFSGSGSLLVLGLFINCLFYGLIIERIGSLLTDK